jgi:hypothetical protein
LLIIHFSGLLQDQWDEFKERFNEEQLEAVNGTTFSPSYFA